MSQQEDLVSEDAISDITSQQNEMEDDESFAVGVRFNITNEKNMVQIKHIANQNEIKVRPNQKQRKLFEIKRLEDHKKEPKQLTEDAITKTIYANTERFRNFKGNEEGIQLKGNRLANRVIGRIGDASALQSSLNTSGQGFGGGFNISGEYDTELQAVSMTESGDFLEVCPIRYFKMGNIDHILKMTQFNAENSLGMKTLKRPKPNLLKRAAQEKHRIDFELLLNLPIESNDEKAKAKRKEIVAREEKIYERLENKELKKILKEYDIDQGKPVYSSGNKRKSEKETKTKLLETQSPHFPSSEGNLINFYADLSSLSRKLVNMDWKDEKCQQVVEQYPHYKRQKNDLALNISELYLSLILGRNRPLKELVQDKIQDTFSHYSGNVTNVALGAIDEGEEMNLSEVSISEIETIEQFPEDNRYSFVRDIETPLDDLLDRSNALKSENLEDLIEQITPSLSKKSINPGIFGNGESMLDHFHDEKPLEPKVFAYELRRAQTREHGDLVGRRQALQYNSAFLQEMETLQNENEERVKNFEEMRKRMQGDSSSKIDTLSQQYTVASNPYGTSGTTEQEEFRPGQIVTVEHSRNVSQTDNDPRRSLEKIAPKRGEKKGGVTFDASALQLELDGHEEAKLIPFIEKAEGLVDELKELQPGDIVGGSAVYNILKEQYSARLRERAVEIIQVLSQIGEFSAIGLEYVVRVAQIGMFVLEEKVKGELWTRVVKEYRKNVEIKTRELKKQVMEKRKQKSALARALKKAGSPFRMNGLIKSNSELGLEINRIIRNHSEASSIGGKRVSNSPTRYSSRTSASSSGKKKEGRQCHGAIDSESKVKVKKRSQESRTPLRSKSSNLFSQKSLNEAVSDSKEKSMKESPISTPNVRSITPFEVQRKKESKFKYSKIREKENMQKNVKKWKMERTKAYAAGVKQKLNRGQQKEKPASILDDMIVTVQKAKSKESPGKKKKMVVSYKGTRGGASRPVLEKKVLKNTVEDVDSEGNEGWLGADLDF